jgi:ABC-type antimicrobial peptide transport system permease subunit
MSRFIFVIKYAIRRMTRDAIKSLILILVATSFTILTSEISFSLEKQYIRMDEAYENIEVEGFLTKKDGTEAKVYSKYIKMFNDDFGEYSSYIKDLCLKRSVYYLPSENYSLPDGSAYPNLIGISRTKADVSLLPVNKVEITYYENYDESAFMSDSDICLVSAQLAEGKSTGTPRIDKDGYITLYAYIELATREMVKIPLKLKVIGTYTNGDKDIYCPWPLIAEILDFNLTGDLYSEGLKFTITDNMQIDEFKEKASKIFVPTGYMGDDKDNAIQYSLTLMDDQLIQTITPLRKNISMLEKVKPIIFVLSAAIGFIACMLFIRNRKPEFANMRSLGTPKKLVFTEAFFEQSLFVITGTLIGTGIYFLIHGTGALFNVGDILIFIACYLAGATVAVTNITRINVMKIMKSNE